MSFGFGLSLPAYPLRGGGGNNPFNQSGPTLDLSFTGNAGNLSGTDTFTLDTNFITPQYQVAAQYAVWVDGSGMTQRNFADIVTFTRASTGTFFDSTGTLQTAAINGARFDFNPSTLVAQGLLIEEQRTNSIRNNTMQGAVAGTPGTLPTNWGFFTSLTGLTRTIVGIGTENGINYLDIRLNGTPSAAGRYDIVYETSTGVAALNGQTWTNSGYFKLQAGTLSGVTAVRLYFEEKNSSGTYLTEQNITITSPTSAALSTQRASGTRTLNQATTAFLLPGFNLLLDGTAIDITLRIGLPQLEQGAFATSVIPTTTTALTRSADVASVNTLSPWFNSTESTIFASVIGLSASTYRPLLQFDDGTANNRLYVDSNSGPIRVVSTVSGSNQCLITLGSMTANTMFKVAGAYKLNDCAASLNAGAVGTDTTATMPTVDRLRLGSDANNYWNGWIQRITYYPRRLPNADLQTITA